MNRNISSIETIVSGILNHEIQGINEIPKELNSNRQVLLASRKAGLREIHSYGYDVLSNTFFVREVWQEKVGKNLRKTNHTLIFTKFPSYYDYLEGHIYKNGCYYKWSLSESFIILNGIRKDWIKWAPKGNTYKEVLPISYLNNKNAYDEIEKNKKGRKQILNKIYECESSAELFRLLCGRNSIVDNYIDAEFYLWNYISKKGKDAENVVLGFLGNNIRFNEAREALGELYGYKDVINGYMAFWNDEYSESRTEQFKTRMSELQAENLEQKKYRAFDPKTHFFYERTEFWSSSKKEFSTYIYYDSLNDFLKALNNDVSGCDFRYYRGVIKTDNLKYDRNTIFPVNDLSQLNRYVHSEFDPDHKCFNVYLEWKNEYKVVFDYKTSFEFFFEYAAFLNYDLSNSNLQYCSTLINIPDSEGIEWGNAIVPQIVMDKLNIAETSDVCSDFVKKESYTFPELIEKEIESNSFVGEHDYDLMLLNSGEDRINANRIYYISDIHLMDKRAYTEATSRSAIQFFIKITVKRMLESIINLSVRHTTGRSILLIGGDVASDIVVFRMFVEELRNQINDSGLAYKVIFILGNHELWEFANKDISDIISCYRDILSEYHMYLLHNEIMYFEGNTIKYIREEDISVSRKNIITTETRCADLILFGGIGFAGYNRKFNANNNIYMKTLNYEQELKETIKFENLYRNVCEIFSDRHRNIIVFTHMPLYDWSKKKEYNDSFVYISGHTHRNYFYDDGITRRYEDNQIGYANEAVSFKYILMNNYYDYFDDYPDDYYEITREEYIDFYRGKNLDINFNRPFKTLYMLKKQGYYCFIIRNNANDLLLLNGGSYKKLKQSKKIEYYYDRMMDVINYIQHPLLEYSKFQHSISNEIKRIGGNGKIHGAIIDIDGGGYGWSGVPHNHLYVNPLDGTITPYYAPKNIVEKYVYASVPALLYNKCPELYSNYKKLISTEKDGIILRESEEGVMIPPTLEKSTIIYQLSRELNKMQKIENNILTTWVENDEVTSVFHIEAKD